MKQKPKRWETYEEVAAYLLNEMATEFGLDHFEGKQNIEGKWSGTSYEIDAKGASKDGEVFFIVECRRYTKAKQSQERIGALALWLAPMSRPQTGHDKVPQPPEFGAAVVDNG